MSNSINPISAEYVRGLEWSQLVRLIGEHWVKMSVHARPYYSAMRVMSGPKEAYGMDSGIGTVLYFLGNAASWRGDVARAVKAELKRRIK